MLSMTRRYHSPRRAATAEQTRRDIVEAAIRLHAGGVTELADLAREAGVALPTVRKHFSTRERVFEACTANVAQTAEPFPFADLAGIADPAQRISASVRRLYQLFETRLGLTWTAYRLAGESPAFAHVLERNQALVKRVADILVDGSGATFPDDRRGTLAAFVRGLLSPLVFRALRLEGGLDVDSAADQAAQAIGRALEVHTST
jgi:AcrR family transcriptional regulator